MSDRLKSFASEIEQDPDILAARSSVVAEYFRYMAQHHDGVDAANKKLRNLRFHYENAGHLAANGPIEISAVDETEPAREIPVHSVQL